MKSILTVILFHSLMTFGQSSNCSFYLDESNEKIYTDLTNEAKPLIKETHILSYFSDNINFDKLWIDSTSNAKTIIKVIVSREGKILKKEVIELGIEGIAEQMFGLIENVKWEPGICENIKVNSELIIPFQICLK